MSNIKKAMVVLTFSSITVVLYLVTNHLYHAKQSMLTTDKAMAEAHHRETTEVQRSNASTTLANISSHVSTAQDISSMPSRHPRKFQRYRMHSLSSKSGHTNNNITMNQSMALWNKPTNTSDFSRYAPGSMNENPACVVPRGGYKAWKQGVVTLLRPVIKRNCTKLFEGDKEEAEKIKKESKSWQNTLSDDEFLERTRNCSWLRKELTNNLYNTALEREIPMAYIFIINGRPQSMFRNLKLLYRPQNTFCINFDTKSPTAFKQTFKNIDRCFENIMIGSKQEDIIWGYYTIMEAQLNCHYDLLKFRESQPPSRKWKYVINLCGKELPLMSPHEMVSRLSVLNGSASITPKRITSKNVYDLKRIRNKVKYSWWHGRPMIMNEKLEPIPFNLTYYKSSSYSILSPKFVHFLLTDALALEVHHFFTKAMHSEEHFYATLFMMPGVPGGYDPKLKDLYVRAAHSTWQVSQHNEPCYGIVVNSICTITARDLPMVMRTSENRTLFHNKYLMEKDHTAMDCLEERIVEKNKLEYQRDCPS